MSTAYTQAPTVDGIDIARIRYRLDWEYGEHRVSHLALNGADLLGFGVDGLYRFKALSDGPLLVAADIWPCAGPTPKFAYDIHGRVYNYLTDPATALFSVGGRTGDHALAQCSQMDTGYLHLNGRRMTAFDGSGKQRWDVVVKPGTRLLGHPAPGQRCLIWSQDGLASLGLTHSQPNQLSPTASGETLTGSRSGRDHIVITTRSRAEGLRRITCLNLLNQKVWSLTQAAADSTFTDVDKESLLLLHNHGQRATLQGYGLDEPTQLWSQTLKQPAQSFRVLDGIAYILDVKAELHALNVVTSEHLWTTQLPKGSALQGWQPYRYGSILIVPCGGIAVLCSRTGRLLQMLETEGVTPDALFINAEGAIYTSTLNAVRCYTLSGYLGSVSAKT